MNSARKGALITASVTSITCIGDTILYSVLPVYAESVGLSDFWLSFFLSINRFIRILSHGVVGYLIIKFGLKRIVTFSSICSSLSSFVYQYPRLIFLFGLSRILWGIAYSGLRQSILVYASNIQEGRKETFAMSSFVKSIGPFLILLSGPIIFEYFGYTNSYFLISIFSLAAVLLAFQLPQVSLSKNHFSYLKVLKFSSFKTLLFLTSFITDGVLVVILFLLFKDGPYTQPAMLVVISSFLLIKRFLSFFLPLIFLKTFKLLSTRVHFYFGLLIILMSLFLLQEDSTQMGLVLAYVGSTIIETTSPILGIESLTTKSKIEIVTTVTLWWDMGKAFGALLGIKLYKYFGNELTWKILGFIVLIISVIYISKEYAIRKKLSINKYPY